MIFFLLHIEIEGKGGWIIGGPKGMLAPLSNYCGGGGGGGGGAGMLIFPIDAMLRVTPYKNSKNRRNVNRMYISNRPNVKISPRKYFQWARF